MAINQMMNDDNFRTKDKKDTKMIDDMFEKMGKLLPHFKELMSLHEDKVKADVVFNLLESHQHLSEMIEKSYLKDGVKFENCTEREKVVFIAAIQASILAITKSMNDSSLYKEFSSLKPIVTH